MYLCKKVASNTLVFCGMKKKIVIRHFGPLENVELDLGRINLIIGLQSSGKSCAMMTACFCTWVEKRIILRNSAKDFKQEDDFLQMLTTYYHCQGYVHQDSYISYTSDSMSFAYDHATKSFTHQWERGHWRYKRAKVSYVPAERNMLSLVSNWNRLETSYDSILDFKADYDIARKYVKQFSDILGTGVSYEFDDANSTDKIVTPSGIRLDLTNSSSGIQSLIPQFVHLEYLKTGIYSAEKESREKSYAEKQLQSHLMDALYERNYHKSADGNNDKIIVHLEGRDFVFATEKDAKQFRKEAGSLLKTDHAEIFLEEPESNLFPPTQFQLMAWMAEMAQDAKHKNFFFIASHSPYVLSYLLQEKLEGFKLFFTYKVREGFYNIKEAGEDDLQEIYDNGSDAFTNFEPFI